MVAEVFVGVLRVSLAENMQLVAELLSVNFTLRIVCMDLDENDIPTHVLDAAMNDWRQVEEKEKKDGSSASLEAVVASGRNTKPCTFVQRPGIALYV